MNIKEIIEALERRINYLHLVKAVANSSGDVEQVFRADEQIAEAQVTLTALRSLV